MNEPADNRRRIAAFDVDGTLTQRDCVVPFIREIGGTVATSLRLLRDPIGLAASAARRDRDEIKAHGARAAFAGRAVADVTVAAHSFAQKVHDEWLRADTLELFKQHRAAGDAVVLVSASFELYLKPLAELLGADGVLAARLEVTSDGSDQFTGALDGPNCRGPEKVIRLRRWLDAHHGGRAAVHVTAYGDSTGDRELLLDADEPVWLGPGSPSWLH